MIDLILDVELNVFYQIIRCGLNIAIVAVLIWLYDKIRECDTILQMLLNRVCIIISCGLFGIILVNLVNYGLFVIQTILAK